MEYMNTNRNLLTDYSYIVRIDRKKNYKFEYKYMRKRQKSVFYTSHNNSMLLFNRSLI